MLFADAQTLRPVTTNQSRPEGRGFNPIILMNAFKLLPHFWRLWLIFVWVISGLACVIASIAWSGCATGGGSSNSGTPTSYPTSYPTEPFRAAPPRNKRFTENVIFLKETNVPVSEVYASFGQPDWESTPLRLIAYRAVNNQALYVVYGTNNYVMRYSVKKIKATDSLQEVAPLWLQSN